MQYKKSQFYELVLLILSVVFYLFFAFYDGAVICADTETYIAMSITREFFYSSFLAIFRMLFGKQYLLMVVVVQSLLAAYVAWNVTVYFRRQFNLGYLLSSVVFFIPLATSLLNRFVAGRGSMYSNSIMTEGITIPLFLLFFRYVYEYIVTMSKKALWVSCVLTAIMIGTRKQMYIALFLLFCAVVFVKMRAMSKENVAREGRKEGVKHLFVSALKAMVLCVALVLTVTLLDHTYNYIVRGRFVGHSSDNRFVLTMVFYTAEEEYVEDLPEEIQPLYLEIYEKCDTQNFLMHSAGEGWYNNVSHFGDNYDFIQIDTMWPAIQAYAENYSEGDPTQRELITDEITNVMITNLMPKTAPKIAKVLVNNFFSGLVTTVAQRNRVLIYYSLVAYLGYIGLLGWYWKKRGQMDGVVTLCLLTLLSIVVNVGLVSAVIFCQTRYTIYNMPLFYISGLMLVKEILGKRVVCRREERVCNNM